MARAWKAMSHMPDRAERIDISPECEVRMLTTDGSDLHRIDKSASASRVLPGRTDGNPPSALLHLFQPFPVHLPPLHLRHPQTMFIQQFAQQGIQRGLRGGGLPRNRGCFLRATASPLAGTGTGRNFDRHFEFPHAEGEDGHPTRAPMPPKSRRYPPAIKEPPSG